MPDATNPTSAEPTKPSPKAASSPSSSPRLEYTPPPRPTRLHRMTSSTRRWARDTFSREQFVAAAKQLAWVFPLTVLIWVYAERAQTTVERDVRFGLEVSSTDPNVFVRLTEPAEGYASADLKGPRQQLEKLRRELGTRMTPVRFEVPRDRRVGEHQFPLAFVVGRDSRFAGLSVDSGSPRNISVQVDTFVTENVPVDVSQQDRAVFEEVVVNPPTVKVRMPSRARPPDGVKLMAYADLSALDRTPGRKSDISGVRVVLQGVPEGQSGVTVEPSTVSVSLTVRQLDQEFPIPQLPIQVSGATKVLNNIKPEIEPPSLFNVILVGPSEVIARMRTAGGPTNVEADVKIELDDLNAGKRSKEVRFRLPQGMKLKSVDGVPVTEGQPFKVDVTVTGQAEGT